MPRKLTHTLLFLCGLILACGAGEGVMRLANAGQHNPLVEVWRYTARLQRRSADPAVGHELIPGKSARLEGVVVSVNSLGMRGPEPDLSSKRPRVLILGDSMAMGWGVADPDTLRGQLATRMPDTEVMSAGVCNYTLSQMVARGLQYTGKIRPDTVIVLATQRAPSPGDRITHANWLLRHSELYLLLRAYLHSLRLHRLGMQASAEFLRQKWTSDAGRARMHNALDRLQADQKKYGYRVIVVMMPEARELHPYRFGFMSRIMAQAAAKRGWTFVDPLPALQSRPAKRYWVAKDDMHPNKAAFRIISGLLMKHLAPHAGGGR